MHRLTAGALFDAFLEHALGACRKKNSAMGVSALSTSRGWFKIPWMLFKKQVPAAYFDLTIIYYSIHGKPT